MIHRDRVANSVPSKRWACALFLTVSCCWVTWPEYCGAQESYVEYRSRGVASATHTPDGKVLVVGGGVKGKDGRISKGYVKLFDPQNNKELKYLTGHEFPVFSVAVTPDGKTVVSGSASPQPVLRGELKAWDTATGKATNLPWINGAIYTLHLSADGKLLAAAGFSGRICVIDVQNRKEIADGLHSGTVRRLVFTPDGKRLASSDAKGTVKLWDPSTMEELSAFKHADGGFSLAFTPDGKTLATGGRGNVVLWNVETGKEIRTLKGHSGAITSLSFSPDGGVLAVGTSGVRDVKGAAQAGEIKLWEHAAGKELQGLKSHAGPVLAVAFANKGKTLRVVAEDGTAKDWSVPAK